MCSSTHFLQSVRKQGEVEANQNSGSNKKLSNNLGLIGLVIGEVGELRQRYHACYSLLCILRVDTSTREIKRSFRLSQVSFFKVMEYIQEMK